MEKSRDKLLAFEYIVYKLVEWYQYVKKIDKVDEFNNSNDFSKLKVLKLHFFIVAINSESNNLLNVFDNFYAMPFGNVESDIYERIDSLERYTIDTKSTIVKEQYLNVLLDSFQGLEDTIKEEIDEAIDVLKRIKIDLVCNRAMELVELSHMWYSWRAVFDKAREERLYSKKIPSDLIKSEFKFLHFS